MKTLFKSQILNRKLNKYTMQRYEVVAPVVNNSGDESGYPEAFRLLLWSAGFEGWTEVVSVGYWQGSYEPGVTFVIYSNKPILQSLCDLARAAMPDQNCIQVTVSDGFTTLVEA